MLCSCGAELDFGAPGGLCTRCLFQLGLADQAGARGKPEPATKSSRDLLDRVGEFELVEEIARGGMGVVYRAFQPSLKREVAVKMVATGRLASPDLLRRFETESEAAGRLSHPNIVPVYAVGEDAGCRFIAMRFVRGLSLEKALDRGRRGDALWQFTLHQSVDLIRKVARAVQYAHDQGVLHRDLKPGNILLDSDGEPYVSDFGLARIPDQNSSLTQTMAVLGTAAYMPPEQASGRVRELTTSGDIYGLGAILYELLTGQPPFNGRSPLETMRHVVERDPQRPRDLNPAVDSDLEAVCLKCLEKGPAARYSTAGAVADELERWQEHQPIHARRHRPWTLLGKWIRREPLLALMTLGTCVAVVLGLGIGFWQHDRAQLFAKLGFLARKEADESHAQLSLARANSMMRAGSRAEAVAVLAGALRRTPDHGAVVERLLTAVSDVTAPPLAAYPMVHGAPVVAGALSPDERHLVTACRDGSLHLWDALRGRYLRFLPGAGDPVSEVAFSANGLTVLGFSRGKPLLVVRLATFRPVAEGPSQLGVVEAWSLSREGRLLALILPGGRVSLWDAIRMEELGSHSAEGPVTGVAMSSNGGILALADGSGAVDLLESFSWNRLVRVGRPRGLPVKVLRFSPDARWLAALSSDGLVEIWDWRAFRDPVAAVTCDDRVPLLEFSPDGLHLASASDGGRIGLRETSTGVAGSQGMFHGGLVRTAAFCRHGRHLVTADAEGVVHLWSAATGQPVADPLTLGGPVSFAMFLGEGDRLLTGSEDGLACLWETPCVATMPPAWLPEVAEAVVRKRLRPGDRFEPVSAWQASAALQKVRRLSSSDAVTRWIQWALDHGDGRTISPGSAMTQAEFIRRSLAETNLSVPSLASRMAPKDARVLARWSGLLSQGGRLAEARGAAFRAVAADPELRDGWLAWARLPEMVSDLDPKPHEILGALERYPEDPELWMIRARLLEAAGRLGEAMDACDRVLALGRGAAALPPATLAAASAARSRLLPRVDRGVPEAVRERRERLGIPPREAAWPHGLVDLSPHYTARLGRARRPVVHVSRDFPEGLPDGLATWDDLLFDVRGVVRLSGSPSSESLRREELGIRVRQPVRQIHFLLGLSGSAERDTVVARFEIHAAGGEAFDLPVRFGRDVRDSWTGLADRSEEFPAVVLTLESEPYEGAQTLSLSAVTWMHPSSVMVDHVDFRSTGAGPSPLLVAMTAE